MFEQKTVWAKKNIAVNDVESEAKYKDFVDLSELSAWQNFSVLLVKRCQTFEAEPKTCCACLTVNEIKYELCQDKGLFTQLEIWI